MQSQRYFCSLASQANAEAIYGSVGQVQSWLLLEYPGAWRKHAIEDSRLLSPPVKAQIQKFEAEKLFDRSLLIRQQHTRCGPIRCFSIDARQDRERIGVSVLADYEDLLNHGRETQSSGRLLYAVCTHGRHDKCCAKFGLPVFCAFREAAQDQAWECSHVGGDRFAANVVVFPYGLYYGHVTPEDAPEVVRLSERGKIWLKGFRGRSSHPRVVQIADYFLREQSGHLGINDFSVLETSRRTEEVREVRFRHVQDGSTHVIGFRKSTKTITALLTCGSAESSTVPQFQLADYRVQR